MRQTTKREKAASDFADFLIYRDYWYEAYWHAQVIHVTKYGMPASEDMGALYEHFSEAFLKNWRSDD